MFLEGRGGSNRFQQWASLEPPLDAALRDSYRRGDLLSGESTFLELAGGGTVLLESCGPTLIVMYSGLDAFGAALLPPVLLVPAALLVLPDELDHLPLLVGLDLQQLHDRLILVVEPWVPLGAFKGDRFSACRH